MPACDAGYARVVLDSFLEALWQAVVGSVPERQPWRAIVLAFWTLVIVAGLVGTAYVLWTAF